LILPPSASDKAGLIRWVEAGMDEKRRIEGLLFKHRKDPTHTRAKYASIKYEVTDAWLVEYP
jgi:Txe/YoeB family toxin of Txe-Axe toxin-antitoxin module